MSLGLLNLDLNLEIIWTLTHPKSTMLTLSQNMSQAYFCAAETHKSPQRSTLYMDIMSLSLMRTWSNDTLSLLKMDSISEPLEQLMTADRVSPGAGWLIQHSHWPKRIFWDFPPTHNITGMNLKHHDHAFPNTTKLLAALGNNGKVHLNCAQQR